jgi:Flp pilus assembly pilin Flp
MLERVPPRPIVAGYALPAGISVAIIAVVNGIGSKLNSKFTSISSQLK